MAGTKRIHKELTDIKSNAIPGMNVSLISDEDIYKWRVVIDGPEKTPYAGGKFTLNLTLPTDYPFKPPTLNFQTKIYHPNIGNDDKGTMCLGMLRPDEWKPASKIAAVLAFARQLLVEPMADDAVEGGIAKEFKEEPAKWAKTAKEWTKRYAVEKK